MSPIYLCLYDLGRHFLGRLNLTEFDHTGHMPPLEKVLDLVEENLPEGMAAFSAGYELYLVGGEKVEAFETPAFNSTMYNLQRTNPPSFEPVRLSSAQIGKPDPKVAEIDGKVYVLGTKSKFFGGVVPSPAFEVYDPLNDTWECLPDPPKYDRESAGLVNSFSAFQNFLIMFNGEGNWVYDVDKKEWNSWESSPLYKNYAVDPYPFRDNGVATYRNIMIAYINEHGLVVYYPDFNSTVSFKILENLNNVISTLEVATGFVHHLGNGKMCSVCFFPNDEFYWAVSVAIFQVNISSNMESEGGNCPVTTNLLRHHIFKADIEAEEYIMFTHAFIMSEGLGKRVLKCQNLGKSSKKTRTVLGAHNQ